MKTGDKVTCKVVTKVNGEVIAINGDKVTVKTNNGIIEVDKINTRMYKDLPKNIDYIGKKYRVRIKQVIIGMYDTLDEAVNARDNYKK